MEGQTKNETYSNELLKFESGNLDEIFDPNPNLYRDEARLHSGHQPVAHCILLTRTGTINGCYLLHKTL